jgi:hypothetical protein
MDLTGGNGDSTGGIVGGTATGEGGTPALSGTETQQAIGAGANPAAEVQFASGEMPNPQADAAGFFKSQSPKKDFTEGNEGNKGKTNQGAVGGTVTLPENEKAAEFYGGQL